MSKVQPENGQKAKAQALPALRPLCAALENQDDRRGGEAMSLIKCDNCGAVIDTDYCPHAYQERLDKWLCDDCHSEWWADQEDDRPKSERYK